MKIKCIRYLAYSDFSPGETYDCTIRFLKNSTMIDIIDNNGNKHSYGAEYIMQAFDLTIEQIDKLRIFQ